MNESGGGAALGTSSPASSPRLLDFIAASHVPWSLAFAGFLAFFIATTTYVANIGFAAMALALVGLLLGKAKIRWPGAFWLLLAFWAWSALATSFSRLPGDFTPVMSLGKVVLVFLVAVNVLARPLAMRFFLLLFAACFALFPIRGTLFNYYLYQSADFGRPHWVQLFGNANDMAAMTILALAVVTGYLNRESPLLVRVGAFLASGVFAFVILLTQSRAAFLGLATFAILMVLNLGRGARFRALLAIALVGTIVVTTVPQEVWGRLAGLKHVGTTDSLGLADQEGSAAQRWAIWQTGSRIIADHPGLGVGLGRYGSANAAYSPELGSKDIHNTFLEVLAETGYPGLILFIAFLLAVIVAVRRAKRDHPRDPEWRRLQYLEFGLYGYLVAGLWGTYGFISLLYVYLAVLHAQAYVVAHSSRPGSLADPGLKA